MSKLPNPHDEPYYLHARLVVCRNSDINAYRVMTVSKLFVIALVILGCETSFSGLIQYDDK